jgi:hypothetical protein
MVAMKKRHARHALTFETLEPRLLLAGDLAATYQPMDLTLYQDQQTQEIVVYDNLKGVELERHDAHGTDKIVVTGSQRDDVFRIDLDSSQVDPQRILIDGRWGIDTIVGPSLGTQWTMDGLDRGFVGNIAFRSFEKLVSSGEDTLKGPDFSTVYTIYGSGGDGTVARVTFHGFEHLVGSDKGRDAFQIRPQGGSTEGNPTNDTAISIYGGLRKYDTLKIQGNNLNSVAFDHFGNGAGGVAIDGMSVEFASIGAISLGAVDPLQDVAQNVSWSVNGDGDNTIVGDNASDLTQISIVTNSGPPVATLAKPTSGGSVSIATTGFSSAITLNTLTLAGIDLSVQSGQTSVIIEPLLQDVSNTITVASGATVTTSLVTGEAGDISLAAANITVAGSASLLAQGSSGGAVSLTATNLREASGLILDTANDVTARDASISLTGATIMATDSVTIQAQAGDRSLEGSMNNYLDGWGGSALTDLEQLTSRIDTLPISVLYKNSAASISLKGTAITTSLGNVTIDASSESDAVGTGIYWESPGTSTSAAGGIAFVFAETDASATVDIGAGTSISATGDVSVTTEGTTNVTGTARVSQNTGRGNSPTNPQNVQVAVAVGITNLTSTITTDANSLLHSTTGDVTVTATGTNSNAPGAETESYKDGLAGFTLGLALSTNTVKVTALGEIEAGATTTIADPDPIFNPFQAIDYTADTIAVDTTAGYQTGDAITYSTGGGGALSGLVDGQTYYVIVVDGTHFQLADSRADALTGTEIDFTPLPALEWQDGTMSYFSQVMESTGQFVFDYDPGIQAGFALYYDPADGQFISGVAPKSTGTLYTVSDVSQSASGNQWLVTLKDSSGNVVMPSLVPLLVDPSNGTPYGFNLDNAAIELQVAQPGFATGQAFEYRQSLGLNIPTLTDGTTYYLVKDPDDTTNTLFRLAASAADATSSDGFSNTVALGKANTNVTSGQHHQLTANNPGGIAIAAKLTTSEDAVTISSQGGEPESSDLAGKGELLPVAGTMLKNIANLATVQKDQAGNITNKMDDKISDNAKGSDSNTNFGVAATVAFVKSTNNAIVEVSNVLRSQSNVTISADITHSIQTQAEGVKAPSQDGTTTLTIAGAAAVGLSYDNAQVIIDGGAAIDAKDAITLDASVTYPFLAPLDSPEDFGEYILDQLKANPLGTISGFLGSFFLIEQDLVNSWARAADNAPKSDVSIAGAVDFQSRSTFATVDVMGGAQINQQADYTNSAQSVSLNASTDMKMINVGGIFDYDTSPEGLINAARLGPTNALQPFGAQGGKTGFGGAYRQLDLNTTTHAIIHGTDTTSGATTAVTTGSAGELDIDATNTVFVLGVTQSGTTAGKFGISGSAAISEQNTSTVAAILSGAVVSGGGISLAAHDDTVLPTYAGDIVKGGNLGFGVGLVYNDINRTTAAYIGDAAGTATAASNITVASITASATNTGVIAGFALAGAEAGSEPATPSSPINNLGTQVNQSAPSLPSGSNGQGSYGVAISADVVFHNVNDSAQAFIDDVGEINAASVELTAENDTKYIAGAGSVAIAKSDGTSVGLAGSYSEVDLAGATETYVNRAELTVGAGQLTMAATWAGLATAAAAGGSGAPRQGGIATSGSVALNRLAQSTAATIGGNASLNVAGQIVVTATNEMQALAVAGSADYGGRAGVGAAGALNISTERVAVGIQGSTIYQTAGDSYWTASFADPDSSTPRLVAVAGAVAVSKGVAADGIVAINTLADPGSGAGLSAYLNNSTYISGPALLVLAAQNDQTMLAVGAAIAGGTKVAIGAGGAANVSTMSIVSEVTDSALHLWGLTLSAARGGSIEAVAVGAALSQDTAAIAGSAAVNVIGETVDAHIQATVAPANDSYVATAVDVFASETTDITAAAGALSINTNGTAAIGAALAFNDITTTSHASISGAHLQVGVFVPTGAEAVVAASMGGTIEAIAVGAEGGQTLAAGGSVAITKTDTAVAAAIDGGAQLTTLGSVAVSSRSTMSFTTIAGQVDAALDGAAVGLANSTLDRADTTTATIDDAMVSVAGTAGLAEVSVADQGARTDGVAFTGLSVTAVSVDTILGVTAGAAGAADVAVAGSATLTLLDKTTRAVITNTADLSDTTIANLNMLAYDETSARTGAGALAGAEYAGIGAGLDVSKLTKVVDASFDAPQTTIAGNAVIVAMSKEELLSTAAVAGGGIGALAGANSTYVFDLQTSALIGDSGTVVHLTTAGSILLAADDQTSINQILGAVDGGGVSIGASAAVVDYTRKDVTAAIEGGADIHTQALDTTTAINAATGTYTVGYTDPDNQAGEVQPPNKTVDLDQLTGNREGTLGNLDAPGLTKMRNASADYESIRGLAVTATNQDSVRSYTFALGGGLAAVEVAANVVVATTNVSASIGNNVGVNNPTPNPGTQMVLVAAGQDFSRLGLNGGLAGGAGAGTAGTDVTILALNTTAKIDDGAVVNASGHVTVSANAVEDILAITAGFGGAAFAALDAGAVVIHIENVTLAEVGAAGVTGNNVGIYANDTTTIAGIAGEVAVGGAGGGIGAGVVVTMIDKSTTANIGNGAIVTALAGLPDTISALDGSSETGPDSLNTKQIQGLAVQATSSELVTAIGASGAGGVIAGLAGGVTVTSIASYTEAVIGNGVTINPGAVANNPLQDVSVAAGNLVQVLDIAGAIGIGAAGIAGGVDTGFIRNGTNAQIGSATVNAGGEVDVFSIALADVESYALSIGAGVVGVAGAVSVWTIGTDFNSTYSDTGNSDNALSVHGSGGQYQASDTYADGQTNRSDIKSLLGNYNASSGSDNTGAANGVVSQALSDYGSSEPQGEIQATYVNPNPSINYALVDTGAVINAAGDFNVKADFTLALHQVPGTAALGLGAAGGSVAIAEVGQQVITDYSGTATIGGTMNVEADYTSAPSLLAFGGALGFFVGVGAQVAVYHDSSQVLAQMSDGSSAQTAGLSVIANTDLGTASVTAEGADAAGLAAGAAVAEFGYSGTTQAIVGSVTITEPGGPTGIADVTIQATTTLKPTASADAAAAGIGAGAGNLTKVDLSATTNALLLGGASIGVSGSFALSATTDINVNASGEGFAAGGIAAAVSFVEASVNDSVTASIGAGSTVSAASITVLAHANDTVTASGTANAGGSLLGGTGVETHADVTPTVEASVTGATSLAASTGNIDVEADADIIASSTATGIDAAGLAIGVSIAYATITPTLTSHISDTGSVTATLGDVFVLAQFNQITGGSATVAATGSDGTVPLSVTELSTAGLTLTPTLKAYVGDPGGAGTTDRTVVTAGQGIEINASSDEDGSVSARNTGDGIFNADGDASATLTRTRQVNAYVGSGVSLTATGLVEILAESRAENLEAIAAGYTGGLASTGNTSASVISLGGVGVDIGSGASIHADFISIGSIAVVAASNVNASFLADGFYSQPEPKARFNLGFDANNNFAEGGPGIGIAGSLTANNIQVVAQSEYALDVSSKATIKSVGGTQHSDSVILVDEGAAIFLNSGASLTAPTVGLSAQQTGNQASTYAENYADGLGVTKYYTSTIDLYGGPLIDRASGVTINSAAFTHTATPTDPSMSDTWASTGTSIHSDNPTDWARDHTTTSDNSGDASAARAAASQSISVDPETGWLLSSQATDDESYLASPTARSATRVDPASGWIIEGQDEADDWLEISDQPPAHLVPTKALIEARP